MSTTMSNEQRKQAILQVKNILAATSVSMPFFSSPRASRAALWAMPIVMLGLIVSQIMVAICIAAVVFTAIWKITSPETWEEKFLKLLTAYQPLDECAYQALLSKINADTCSRADIQVWLNMEVAQVDHPAVVAAQKVLLDTRLHQN